MNNTNNCLFLWGVEDFFCRNPTKPCFKLLARTYENKQDRDKTHTRSNIWPILMWQRSACGDLVRKSIRVYCNAFWNEICSLLIVFKPETKCHPLIMLMLDLCNASSLYTDDGYIRKMPGYAGICVCGAGVGTFVMSPLEATLLQSFGWRGTMRLVLHTAALRRVADTLWSWPGSIPLTDPVFNPQKIRIWPDKITLSFFYSIKYQYKSHAI